MYKRETNETLPDSGWGRISPLVFIPWNVIIPIAVLIIFSIIGGISVGIYWFCCRSKETAAAERRRREICRARNAGMPIPGQPVGGQPIVYVSQVNPSVNANGTYPPAFNYHATSEVNTQAVANPYHEAPPNYLEGSAQIPYAVDAKYPTPST